MPIPSPSIGNWTVSQLVRFIKDMLKNDPPQNFTFLRAQTVKVTGNLVVGGPVTFETDKGWQIVSGNGQPPFTASWASWGSPYHPVSYWRDALGVVRLRGVLKSGTVGSSAFTLPPGYRPAAVKLLPALSNGAIGRVDIGADGTVTPQLPSSNVYVSLDGLEFQAV